MASEVHRNGFFRLRGGDGVQYLKTKTEFDEALKNAGDKIVVVDFTATWCGPCKRIAPVFEQLAEKNKAGCVFYKVDVDENDEVAQEQGVSSMPTFFFFKQGKKIGQSVGALEETLVKALEDAKRAS
eukprot:CAMPEP_0185258104 /NCGR_PEP_ID=MMETSP1359-20130426/7085_1 /TAXON_ID=552665 /ORGANISM="Bigelowiella longifila, Strain CCMP242" /LENGTH=126 /DNA_ID=CAMNT_0027843467 /DNA_START=288 /DNA_END=668 /DNA_ORIENTATION=+